MFLLLGQELIIVDQLRTILLKFAQIEVKSSR